VLQGAVRGRRRLRSIRRSWRSLRRCHLGRCLGGSIVLELELMSVLEVLREKLVYSLTELGLGLVGLWLVGLPLGGLPFTFRRAHTLVSLACNRIWWAWAGTLPGQVCLRQSAFGVSVSIQLTPVFDTMPQF